MHWEAFDSGHSICELILFRILKLSSSTLVHIALVHMVVWWSCCNTSNIQHSGVTLVVHLVYWWHTGGRLVDGGGKKGGRHSGTQFPQWKKPEAPSLSRSNYRVGKYGLNRFISIWQVPILRNSTYIRITIMASLTRSIKESFLTLPLEKSQENKKVRGKACFAEGSGGAGGMYKSRGKILASIFNFWWCHD